jgi:Anti-sigma-28 factor, FlgM
MNLRVKGGNPGQSDPDPPTAPEAKANRVIRLKQQIALGRYRVDADAVAREMIFKLRLLSLSRRALLADRTGDVGRHARPVGDE